MKKTLVASAAVVATLAAASSHAADSAELKINGKILPPACALAIENDGVVDFGVTLFNTLSATGTKLGERTANLSISCQSPMLVGLSVIDNRAATKLSKDTLPGSAWANTNTGINNDYIFGLGMAKGKSGDDVPVGGVMVGFKNGLVTVDSTPQSVVIYSTDEKTWGYTSPFSAYFTPSRTYSFVKGQATSSNDTPYALKTMSGQLSVVPTINSNAVLSPYDVINLDGHLTISLRYL